MALPIDSSHLSSARDLYMAEYGGMVESQFAKSSIMRQFVRITPVRGTNTLQNNRVGKTNLAKVTPGVRPDSNATKFGKVSVTVDTIIIARDNVDRLDVFQSNFDHRAEIGMDHGKEIGKFFDEAFLIKAIHGSYATPADTLDGAFGAGDAVFGVDITTGDEVAAENLYQAMKQVVVAKEEADIEASEFIWFVRPSEYAVLVEHDKALNSDYASGNGDYAMGITKEVYGVPITKTARIPRQVNAAHLLGASYNVDATDAACLAVLLHPRSLLAGETIPLTHDVYYDQKELQWFIDSHLAFGVNVNREDLCGGVFSVADPRV